MYLAPGQTYYDVFCVHSVTTMALADADSTPTAVAIKDGVVDSGYVLTVTRLSLGRYAVSGAVPASYALGVTITPVAVYTVGAVAQEQALGKAMVDGQYWADIALVQGAAADLYEIRWFKNGARVTSGITSPTIQVLNRTAGTDLVASTTPTQVGSTGAYKHDESTNRMVDGQQSYEIVVTATIDNATRTFSRLVGRDV